MTAPPIVAGGPLDLARLTPARVALGRSGASLPTAALLAFGLDHARARDAVHAAFDVEALKAEIGDTSVVISVQSQARDRPDYLKRPDLGRLLDAPSRDHLQSVAGTPCDIAFVLGDGLSPAAVAVQGPALFHALKARLDGFSFAPPVIACGARVALGDEIGSLLNARLVVMLIGERPGLSTPESLGVYLTYGPRPGLTDADRNCVSNIHAAGLSCDAAAQRISWLVIAALARGLTGIALKDDSTLAALPPIVS